MVDRQLDQQYRLLYSARPAAAEPQSKKSWIGLMKLLAQSGTIFIDDHAPVLDWLKLDDDTTLIQLWHAGAGFKSSGYSRWGHEGCPSPQSCHRQYKYGIAGSKNIAPFFRKYGELMMSKYCQQECPVWMSIWMSSIGMKK